MAMNEIHIEAPPDRVFEVLSTAELYPQWVVGAKEVRAVDDNWPEPGSKFHHSVGLGPYELEDNTKVLELDPPRRLVLEARARPVGRAKVQLLVEPDGSGTRVRMVEDVLSVPNLVRRLLEPAMHTRNEESLRRLSQLCERERPAG